MKTALNSMELIERHHGGGIRGELEFETIQNNSKQFKAIRNAPVAERQVYGGRSRWHVLRVDAWAQTEWSHVRFLRAPQSGTNTKSGAAASFPGSLELQSQLSRFAVLRRCEARLPPV